MKVLIAGNGFEMNLNIWDSVSGWINGQVKRKYKILLKLKSTNTEWPETSTDTGRSTLNYL